MSLQLGTRRSLFGARGGIASPLEISGCILWLDGSDTDKLYTDSAKTTPVSSDGDVVGAWEDKSGNGKDATQATTSLKPLYKVNLQNSKSGVRFDGTDDVLSVAVTGTSAATIFVVMKQLVNDAAYVELFYLYNFGTLIYPSISRFEVLQNNDRVVRGGANVKDAYTIIVLQYDGAGVATTDFGLFRNGATRTLSSTEGVYTPTDGRIGDLGGASDPANYDLCELIVYNEFLNANNRQSVEKYLNRKWSIY